MKSFTLMIVGAALAAAQTVPACGQYCLSSMIGKAAELGCAAGDASCLCSKADFGFGIRDCALESCPEGDKQPSINAGLAYCEAVVAGTASTSSSGAASSTSGAETSTEVAASSSAITTSEIVSTVTSDGSTSETTIGSTTIFAAATPAGASALTTLGLTSEVTSDGSTYATTTGYSTVYVNNSTVVGGAGVAPTSTGASGSMETITTTTTSSTGSNESNGMGGSTSAVSTTSSSHTPSGGNANALQTAAPAFIGLAALAVMAM